MINFKKAIKAIFVFAVAIFLQACITLTNERFEISKDVFDNNYPAIKEIVLEEASNYGFSELMSEIKPSEFNNWNGKLFFQLATVYGTDQLGVEFEEKNGNVEVYINGGGTRTDPSSAARAIKARLSEL